MSNVPLPWQDSKWKTILRQKEQNQLPHAMLFVGMPGVGKKVFAEQFSHALLCSAPNEHGFACGQCKHCQLVAAGNHPDLFVIEPEAIGKAIKIDRVRELISQVAKTAQLSSHKVILIQPADAMNINAANALLKTLEEPTPSTIIILITEHASTLPATIRSRCQIVHFRVPEKAGAKTWLALHNIEKEKLDLLLHLTHGAPLKVLELVEKDELSFRENLFKEWCQFLQGKLDLIDISKKWSKLDIASVLQYLMSWLNDLILLSQIPDLTDIVNLDFLAELKAIASKYSTQQFYEFYDELLKAQTIISKHIALNQQLLLEGLLMRPFL